MGKVNICLKRSYILVTSLMVIISALILAFTLFAHGHFHADEEIEKVVVGLHMMYILSITTLLFSITGLFGVCKKKKWALILFTVGMILCTLYMVFHKIATLALLSKITEEVRGSYLGMMPLSQASEADTDALRQMEMELHCCGLERGHIDWGYNISLSCLCSDNSESHQCVEAPFNSSLSSDDGQQVFIYVEPCLPSIISLIKTAINIGIGMIFGLIIIWVLSLALGITILCQMDQKNETPTVVYSQEAKSGNYTVLTEPDEFS